MKQKLSSIKYFAAATVTSLLLANCTTYYDAQGNPVQAVDPAAAVVGAVAVGAVAYAVGQNNSYRHRSYHAPKYYGPRRFR